MSKKKLLEDIRRDPARIYRSPGDVLRDRRFGDGERIEILKAWRDRDDETGPLIDELQARLIAQGHAAE